jgi:hypothetical protein
MMVYQKATWKNGKKTITGKWAYHWASDQFYIYLDSVDPVTGAARKVVTGGDHPEWGNWKRVEGETK